ncbi:MAG: TldD/PmbA family protein [Rhodomicrobium sp.]
MSGPETPSLSAEAFENLETGAQANLADTALRLAAKAGAAYADFRIGRDRSESIFARENKLQHFNSTFSEGFGVRVLLDGSWGFAASRALSEAEVSRAVAQAAENARAARLLQTRPIVLEDIPAYQDEWIMPVAKDPFAVPVEEKAAKLLGINAAALKAGADFCSSGLWMVREEKLFMSSRGSRIQQARVRIFPQFTVTAVDKQPGRFATRDSLLPARAAGWEYVSAYNGEAEAALAAAQAREKLAAKTVEPGVYDVVIGAGNLWLTIHESVGHSTELDRALGWEADFAGTSFVTPDMLDRLQFGSPLMTVIADRSQEGGLATVGYDDDGVRTQGAEFPIVEKGIFRNYQMAMGQAQFIGRERSNGCAYADSPTAFPIQRMPNISLRPSEQDVSLADLIAGVDRGIYISGAGSWSIDQQRDNFQFGGQLFWEIENGRLGPMLRDVAYQARTVPFWNSLDGIGGKATYELGGAFTCGKAQPMQLAPVSHGAVPARFRGVTILNTGRADI